MEDFIKALQILLKYGNPRNPFHCEHDYLYIDIQSDLVSEEDKVELKSMGIFEDEENGGFGSYRYGSC